MSERVYTTIDKSEWGPGPWQDEPDKVQWKDEATGLPCLAKRGPSGAWCGYVGVPEGNPFFGADYALVCLDAESYEFPDVHGGLTYSDHCQAGDEATAICHVPDPGEPDHVWWLGFDCAHSGDLAPARSARQRERYEETGETIWLHSGDLYRTLDYVRGEVTRLAEQLAR